MNEPHERVVREASCEVCSLLTPPDLLQFCIGLTRL